MVDSAREQISQKESDVTNSVVQAGAADVATNSSSTSTVQHSVKNPATHISPISNVPNACSNEQSSTRFQANLTDNEEINPDNITQITEDRVEGATASSSVSSGPPKSKAEKDKKNQQKKSGIDVIGNYQQKVSQLNFMCCSIMHNTPFRANPTLIECNRLEINCSYDVGHNDQVTSGFVKVVIKMTLFNRLEMLPQKDSVGFNLLWMFRKFQPFRM